MFLLGRDLASEDKDSLVLNPLSVRVLLFTSLSIFGGYSAGVRQKQCSEQGRADLLGSNPKA